VAPAPAVNPAQPGWPGFSWKGCPFPHGTVLAAAAFGNGPRSGAGKQGGLEFPTHFGRHRRRLRSGKTGLLLVALKCARDSGVGAAPRCTPVPKAAEVVRELQPAG